MTTPTENALNAVAVETARLRRQLDKERWWRRLIMLLFVLVVAGGVWIDDTRRDNESRACQFANENREGIKDAFDVLIMTSLRDAPADDPRRARAAEFTADLEAKLPARDCD